MEPTERLARSCPRYKGGASLSRRGGQNGADERICTFCLRITNALHILMCFDGMASQDRVELSQSGFGDPRPEVRRLG